MIGNSGLKGLGLWGVLGVIRSYCPDFIQQVTF